MKTKYAEKNVFCTLENFEEIIFIYNFWVTFQNKYSFLKFNIIVLHGNNSSLYFFLFVTERMNNFCLNGHLL